jgi:hypothetical protein
LAILLATRRASSIVRTFAMSVARLACIDVIESVAASVLHDIATGYAFGLTAKRRGIKWRE